VLIEHERAGKSSSDILNSRRDDSSLPSERQLSVGDAADVDDGRGAAPAAYVLADAGSMELDQISLLEIE